MEFNPKLEGISHGMGSSHLLPHDQLNVAHSGAETDNLLSQANELVKRLNEIHESRKGQPLSEKWVLIFVTIGTEELCSKCDEPHIPSLRRTLTTLRKGIPNAIIVLIGPIHVTKSSQQTYNLLKPRCPCLSKIPNTKLRQIQRKWREGFLQLEEEFNKREYMSFEVLTLPLLQITSRYPEQLFLAERPLLNRRGHAYAAKWLWNRLISGPRYNVSKVVLSEESYYCPSLKCPYFRTSRNLQNCVTMTISEYERVFATTPAADKAITINYRLQSLQDHLGWYIGVAIFLCTVSVFSLGTIFYCHGLKQTKGRFENVQGV
uniref:Uncharacterized protein n=1 Tax=Panagrolaimus davidi TaxID=227884 RepID=A0A914P5B7_9BILA